MGRCDTTVIPEAGCVLLACDKSDRRHLVHRDPATGIRYIQHPWGTFDLCGLRKHRDDCPLRP